MPRAAKFWMPCMTPRAGFFGVVATFSTASVPPMVSSSTRSVCVPPTSTPNRYLVLIGWTFAPQGTLGNTPQRAGTTGHWLSFAGFSIVAAVTAQMRYPGIDMPSIRSWLLALFFALLAAVPGHAQEPYPSHVVKIVLPVLPG